jgi:hypothetical protein
MSRAVKSRVRFVAGGMAMAAVFLASACLQSTGPQPSLIQLAGSWNYTGIQTSPVRETLSGTLDIQSESGTSFQGRVDLVGVNQAGQNRILGGLVSGSEQSNVIDFEASVETTPRRHVGQIVADTISGIWVGSGPDGTTSSGTFRVERVTR